MALDRAPVTVGCASLKTDTYCALLHDIALINAAKLKRVVRHDEKFAANASGSPLVSRRAREHCRHQLGRATVSLQ